MAIRAMRAIRLHCKDCSGDSFAEVARCTVLDCYLWPLRFGTSQRVAAEAGKQVDPKELSGKDYQYLDGGPGKYKEIDSDES